MTLMELQRPINSPVLNLWDVRVPGTPQEPNCSGSVPHFLDRSSGVDHPPPTVIQRRLTHWWTTALQTVVQPDGQANRWKTVRPSLRQAQRWNQAGSNNAMTPLSSRRTTVGGECGITANNGPTHPDQGKWPGGVHHRANGRSSDQLRERWSDQWNWLGDRRWTSVMRSLPKRAPLHNGWTDRHPAITQRSSTSNPLMAAFKY
ncbi:hypothetical protein PCASD_00301 [Puccinia coronata f. sp. avenae]|uniref:Uncharacterized protein n=1 Tax=Puccinia coronata f. sp. avenae TaxID=200324 RepID=A0A2N5VNC4_9BASI|nr:hypothetical protein PCASD_00301 [Puccinia coronata f. sp. avenae]